MKDPFSRLVNEQKLDDHALRARLLEGARRGYAPLRKIFVQRPNTEASRSSVLADMVRSRQERALDALLLEGGDFIWAAGPLAKGSNLCHGTGGNGYAFLKLHRRTGDALWLDRAQAFAMTAVAQFQEARDAFGQGRYSLWTGDVGLAIYLWDCLSAEPRFPTIEVF